MSLPTSDDESNAKLSPTGTGDSSTEEELKVASSHLEVIALDSPSSGNVSLLEVPSAESVTSSPRKTDTEPDPEIDPKSAEQTTLSETEIDTGSHGSSKATVSEIEAKSDTEKAEETTCAAEDSAIEDKNEPGEIARTRKSVPIPAGDPEDEVAADDSAKKSNGTRNPEKIDTEDKQEGVKDIAGEVELQSEHGGETEVSKSSSSILPDTSGMLKIAYPPGDEIHEDAAGASSDQEPKPVCAEEHQEVLSGPSRMTSEQRKSILKSHKEDVQPLQNVLKKFFQPGAEMPSGTLPEERERMDTLDDVSEFSFDTQSTRLTSVDSEAEQSVFSGSQTPDRSRRSVSAPTEATVKVTVVRRAFSEAPSIPGKTAPETDEPAEQMEVDSPVSSFASQQISYEDSSMGESENIAGERLENLPSRQVSEEPENVGEPMENLPSGQVSEESQNVGEPMENLPSQQVSEESENVGEPMENLPSQHTSEESENVSDVIEMQGVSSTSDEMVGNGDSCSLTDPSTRSSEVERQCQNLQGWLDKGKFEDSRHLTEQAGPSNLALDSALMPPPGQLKLKRLSDIEESDASELSSLSDATRSSSSSDVGNSTTGVTEGASGDDRHLTKPDEHPDESPGEVQTSEKSSKECVEQDKEVKCVSAEDSHKSSEESKRDSQDRSKPDEAEKSIPVQEPQSSKSESLPEGKIQPRVIGERTTRSKRKRLDTLTTPENPEVPSGSGDPEMANPRKAEGMASKKYRSEFSRPVEVPKRTRKRSNSTGSVRDVDEHSREFRDWKKSLRKRTPKKGDPEDSESEDPEEN